LTLNICDSYACLSGFAHRFEKSTKPANEQNDFHSDEQNLPHILAPEFCSFCPLSEAGGAGRVAPQRLTIIAKASGAGFAVQWA
jgi:hypothetical protein